MLSLLEAGVIPFPEIARLCAGREHLLRGQGGYKARIRTVRPRAHRDARFCQCPIAYPAPVIVLIEQHVGIHGAHVLGGGYTGKAEWLVAGQCRHVAGQGVGFSTAGAVAGVELHSALYYRKRRFAVGCA
ncbi:hypothetical protein D3C73_1210160 [compost metagenome]